MSTKRPAGSDPSQFPDLARPDGALVSLRAEAQPTLARVSQWELGSELLARLIRDKDGPMDERTAWLGSQLSFALRDRLDLHINRFALRRYRDLYGCLHAHVQPRIPIEGKTIVDLGCGGVNPLGFLFVFLALGARCGIGVDLDQIQDHRIATLALGDVAAQMTVDPTHLAWDRQIDGHQVLKNLSSFRLAQLHRGEPEGIDQQRLRFLRESVYEMSIPDGEADVVMSNAFLEHIPDVERGIKEIARITRSGGFSVHNIDMTDHRRYGGGHGPLDFLTDPSDEPIVHHSNRVRVSEFVRMFERQGFEVVQCDAHTKLDVPPALRAKLTPRFAKLSQQDLETGMAVVVARRR